MEFSTLAVISALFFGVFQVVYGQPMPPLLGNDDPIVTAILNKISALMRKHYNIEHSNDNGPFVVSSGGPPPLLIRYTVPQALSILKNLQKEYNMTEDTEFDYLLSPSSPLKARWRARPRQTRTRYGQHKTSKRRYFLRSQGFSTSGQQTKKEENPEDCLSTPSGHDYKGTTSVTMHGFPCQRWDSQTPHAHRFTNATDFPDGSLKAAANYCRNPNPQFRKGVWCYTNAETFIRWDLCRVPLCKPQSIITPGNARHGFNFRFHRTFFKPMPQKQVEI